MKKKILHITSSFQYGGTEAYIMNNLRNIDRDQFQFHFWFFDEKESPYSNEIVNLGGSVFLGELPRANNIVSFSKNLINHIKRNGPYEAVHVHVNLANAWVLLIAFIAGIKIRISHSHAITGRDTREISSKIYYKLLECMIKIFASKKLACSEEAGVYLYGKKSFKRKGEVVKNGIDVAKYLYERKIVTSKLRKEFDIPNNYFIIGNITRLDANKNPTFTLKVFYEMLKSNPRSILILGGVGEEEVKLRECVKKMRIENKVRFIGSRNDVSDWLHILDVFLFPSLTEGLGIALLEAQAARLNCFCSTGVPSEADINLGLVHYMDISKGEKYWADVITNNHNECKVTESQVQEAFEHRGYHIKSSVRRIENIYKGF